MRSPRVHDRAGGGIRTLIPIIWNAVAVVVAILAFGSHFGAPPVDERFIEQIVGPRIRRFGVDGVYGLQQTADGGYICSRHPGNWKRGG